MSEMPDPTEMTDAALVREYQQTSGEPGDPRVEALVAEMERRDIDF